MFYEDNNRVLSRNIIDVDGVELQVHATVQANKNEHRFVPIYINSKGDKVPKEKPHAKFPPCVYCVNQSQILATAPIEKFLVPKSALSSLRSRGVVMSPITVHRDDTQPPRLDSAADSTSANTHHSDLVQALDAIAFDHDADNARHCAYLQEAIVFPLITLLPRTEQIRYMRLLRGIARALGVAHLGPLHRYWRQYTSCASAANRHTRQLPWP